ncbi:hypothetical protein C8R43DRAFT_893852, partial [Mycena crocata]
RAEASIISQLRTGPVGINAPLHRIKVVDSPMCVRCGIPETISHYPLVCRRYVDQRSTLRSDLKPRTPLTLSSLLSHKNIGLTVTYIKNTGRFPNTLRNHRPPSRYLVVTVS